MEKELGEATWIWEHRDWPNFGWNEARLADPLANAHRKEGRVSQAAIDSAEDTRRAQLDAMLSNILNSAAIEGERLDAESVRSSLARRLGLPTAGLSAPQAESEGMVQMLMDATEASDKPLTKARLMRWHRLLFPGSSADHGGIRIGAWRGPEPMQVVSGPHSRRRVHFQAPPRERVAGEMSAFFNWLKLSKSELDPVVRAGVAHLWFVTIHPFDDGNGRIARAISDFVLAQSDAVSVRCYALSAAIMDRRKRYYGALEAAQRSSPVDITPWLLWFTETLEAAIDDALRRIQQTLVKTRFWAQISSADLNERMKKVLNRMLDAEEPFKLTTRRYVSLTKVSKATATRDLQAMVQAGCIEPIPGAAGRSTGYRIRLRR